MDFSENRTIVFLGDSVTEGCFGLYPTDYGFDTYKSEKDAYPYKLSVLLADKYGREKITPVNAGVRGDNARRGLLRLENDVLSKAPDIVTVCFGLNDSLGSLDGYLTPLEEIFRRVISSGAVPVFITPNMMNTYLHASLHPNFVKIAEKTMEAQNSGRFESYIKSASELASRLGVRVVDVYSRWKKLFSEGVDTTGLLSNYINHPAKEMHDVTADMLFDAVTSL